ncbi:hypothetical protein D3C80_1669380 [compost metagenome]
MQFEVIAGDRHGARTIGRTLPAITEGIQLLEKVTLGQFLADEQLQRPGIDLGGHSPALAGELLLHHCIEVNRKAGEHHQTDQTELDSPAQPGAHATRAAL